MYIVISGELEARIDFSKKFLTENDIKSIETDLELSKQELNDFNKARTLHAE
jgi:hypothetical protein